MFKNATKQYQTSIPIIYFRKNPILISFKNPF